MEAVFKKDMITGKAVSAVFGVSVFIVLMALGAFVRIPLPWTPVPLTLQTFFVLLSGALLGSGLGVSAVLGYILLGLAGVPLFSGSGSGLFYIMGPTGGYLIGFVLASLLVGRFIRYSGNNFFAAFVTVFLADLALLLCGVIWLKFLFGQSFTRLMLIGFVPFIPGDLLKSCAVTFVYFRLRSRIRGI